MLTRGAQYGMFFGGGRRDDNNNGGVPFWLIALVVSLVVYAVSFFLTRLLSRYRELCADRSGAYLTQQAVRAGQRADQDQRRRRRDPEPRPARGASR